MSKSQDIQLYNSLTREKTVFAPIDPAHVRLYACGPTVYNYAHIGNARMAVVFDLLARLLKTVYPKVTYVSNITDVDDKIMAASRETGQAISEITEKYTRIYNEDMAALGCSAPDVQPRATTHIAEMIALIEMLIKRDMAYAADGHVLFNVPAYAEYGRLSGRSRDEQIAGARVEVASYKKDPADFVLWKPSNDDEPGWDSPWGRGRPGWHIECSAMAEKHLNLPFDIHGGGADLKFPHHENEIAQSCGAHGVAPDGFARFWVHNGFVTVEGEKMSKSLGNFTLAHDLLDGKPDGFGLVVRLALLSAQYRKPLDWSAQALHQADVLAGKIKAAWDNLKDVQADATVQDVDAGVLAALSDDLNSPLAFARLNELLGCIAKADAAEYPALKATLKNTLTLLGVENIVDYQAEQGGSMADLSDAEKAEIDALVLERTQAKKDKNFARADEIRNELGARGIEVTDTPTGAVWKKL